MSAAPNLMQGSTNTIRVGTSPRTAPRSNSVRVGQTPSGRRVVRQSVPQRVQPVQAVSRRPVQGGSLTSQQNKYRAATQGPRFQHNLDGAPARPQNMMARPNTQRPQQGQQAPQQQTHAPQGRPPIGVPIQGQQQQAQRRTAPVPQQRAIPRGSVNDPVTHANGAQRVQAAAQRQAAMTYEQAQQSLFGSLNDDVQAPRPMMAPPADPNAPIPTSQRRPTQPVSQGSLGALAGAPRG